MRAALALRTWPCEPLKPSRGTPTLEGRSGGPSAPNRTRESEERVMGKKKDRKTAKKDKKATKAKSAPVAPERS